MIELSPFNLFFHSCFTILTTNVYFTVAGAFQAIWFSPQVFPSQNSAQSAVVSGLQLPAGFQTSVPHCRGGRDRCPTGPEQHPSHRAWWHRPRDTERKDFTLTSSVLYYTLEFDLNSDNSMPQNILLQSVKSKKCFFRIKSTPNGVTCNLLYTISKWKDYVLYCLCRKIYVLSH